MTIVEFLTARLDEDEQHPSPSRTAAVTAAHRAIVAELEEYWDEAQLTTEEYAAGHGHALLWVARQIASVYADHPDYQDAWKL